MAEQIITEKVEVWANPPGPAPPSPQTRWRVIVQSEEGPVDTYSSSDYNDAKKHYSEVIKSYPSATVNGRPAGSSSPFEDGTMSPPSYAGASPPPSPSQASFKPPETLKDFDPDIPDPSSTGTWAETQSSTSSKLTKAAEDVKHSPNSNVTALSQKQREEARNSGALGGMRVQARVNYNQVASEKILRNPDGNAMIVLGNDRWGHESGGYGGLGHTQCDRIDLVAGVGGHSPKQSDKEGNPYWTNPNFFLDAARVYISQKTDVDENFGIGKKESYSKSEAKSAVVIKADNIRLVGRESLKLVTNTDSNNSQGGEIHGWKGIHLMANNDEDGLQPIPKGDNLIEALEMMNNNIGKLAKMFDAYVDYQNQFNDAIAMHNHQSPFFFLNTTPDLTFLPKEYVAMKANVFGKTGTSIMKNEINLKGFRNNYLLPSGKGGKPTSTYINSRFNKTS
jgi:hypothetical protein